MWVLPRVYIRLYVIQTPCNNRFTIRIAKDSSVGISMSAKRAFISRMLSWRHVIALLHYVFYLMETTRSVRTSVFDGPANQESLARFRI